jgi:hypothetical protein
MKCGTGTPLYGAISDPTSTHKKDAKRDFGVPGVILVGFSGVGRMHSSLVQSDPAISRKLLLALFRYHRRDLVVGRVNDHELPLNHCK